VFAPAVGSRTRLESFGIAMAAVTTSAEILHPGQFDRQLQDLQRGGKAPRDLAPISVTDQVLAL
jgi:hypothetical protein